LITGITGYIGGILAGIAVANGKETHGTTWEQESGSNVQEMKKISTVHHCDMRNKVSVERMIKKISPERIFHLAAQSMPTTSWTYAKETLETNILGTVNIYEAVKKVGIDPVVVVACSSAEYGQTLFDRKNIPVTEEHPLLPLHPYGVSKVAQDLLSYQYFKNFGIKVVRCRIFNTTGPGKTKDAAADWAVQVARIEAGLQKPVIKVGNLGAFRDITDGRDMALALLLASEKCKHGEVYNISSSKPYKMRDILDKLIHLSETKISVETDPTRMRHIDEPIISSDNRKFVATTGWQPQIPVEKTLEDMLNWFREKIRKDGNA